MSSQLLISLIFCFGLIACSDDDPAGTETDGSADGQSTQPDASEADASQNADAQSMPDAAASEDAALDAAVDAGTCAAEAPIAPGETSCTTDDVSCFFQADTEEERAKCAEESQTGASCLECVLLGGAACAYDNGCEAEWNDLYCCQQRECGNEPFAICPACAAEAAVRQACETSVAAKCLTAGTSCFPPL